MSPTSVPAPAESSQNSQAIPLAKPSLAPLFSAEHVDFLNTRLAELEPPQIVEWAITTLPGLFQTTAFGPTGCVILDLVAKASAARNAQSLRLSGVGASKTSSLKSSSSDGEEEDSETTCSSSASSPMLKPTTTSPYAASNHLVPLIFLDTLYHFPETLALAQRAAIHYNAPLFTFQPAETSSRSDFETRHGKNLWETNPDVYDYLVKVEPAQRAYASLGVRAYFTGRRRTQNGERSAIPILELEPAAHGGAPLLKINALASWNYDQVWSYIQTHNVPYNALIDQGYKSIGDVHSTQPTRAGEGEREGRWRGTGKTECGLHKDYFRMRAAYLEAAKKKKDGLSSAASAAVS
ncbi:phosphoadenosine phosphosulfate reductase [Phlyctochytrium arcticum]|nr:phosphoadenosine phosphosulfate reductase [Phlyctochytrium arcticum]